MPRVVFSAHGERAFGSAPRRIQERMVAALAALAEDSLWHRRAYVKKLRGSEDRYRLRVGRWRVLCTHQDGTLEVADVFLKKERGDYRRRG